MLHPVVDKDKLFSCTLAPWITNLLQVASRPASSSPGQQTLPSSPTSSSPGQQTLPSSPTSSSPGQQTIPSSPTSSSPGQQTITSPPTSSRPGPRPDKSRPCIGLSMHFCYSMLRGIQQSVLSKENLWDQPYLVFGYFLEEKQ